MGQSECLKLLEKKKKWMTSREVAKCLKQEQGIVGRSLRKLAEDKFIKKRKTKRDYANFKVFEWKVKNENNN